MPDLFARPYGPDGEPAGPMRRLGTMETMRVSGKLTLHGQGPVTEHLNAVITASDPFWYDLGWDGRPIRTDGEWTAPIEMTFPQTHLSLAFWVLFFTNASDAPPPISRGATWRTGVLAACYRALHWPYEPAPLAITRLWDKNWRPTRHLTLERDYPPLAYDPRIFEPQRTDFMPHYPS